MYTRLLHSPQNCDHGTGLGITLATTSLHTLTSELELDLELQTKIFPEQAGLKNYDTNLYKFIRY